MKRRLAVAGGGDAVNVMNPRFAVVEAQLFLRLAGQQIVGAFDVGGGERRAVTPFDARADLEARLCSVFAPRPARREFGHDRLDPVLRHMLIEEHEVVEHPHHRHDRRYAALLEDRHAGRAVAVKHPQNAAPASARAPGSPAQSR
jgi:hypothetical protein